MALPLFRAVLPILAATVAFAQTPAPKEDQTAQSRGNREAEAAIDLPGARRPYQ